MSSLYNDLKEGLEEAISYEKGVSKNIFHKCKRVLPDDWDMSMIAAAKEENDGESMTLQEVEDMLKSEP